jgi:antitoxin CptB
MPFFEEVYQDLTKEDQLAYARLLEQDDPDLLDWLSRQSAPEDDDLKRLISMILARIESK